MKTNHLTVFALCLAVLVFPQTACGQSAQEADSIFSQGQALFNKAQSRADAEKALELFEKALAMNKRLGRTQPQGWNLNDIGLVYRSWGQYEKSLEYFEKALQIYRPAGNQKEEAVTLHNAAQVYYDWGQYKKALEYFEKALAINKKIGRTLQQGMNLNDIGLIYRSWGQYPKALEYFEESQKIYRSARNEKEEAVTLHNTAQVYYDWGQYQKALELFEKALALNKKLGRSQPMGWNLNDIGLVYRSWGQYQKAMEYFEKALQIYRAAANLKEEAVTLHNVAQAYYDWGQYQKALEMYEKSYAINGKLGRRQAQGINLNDIGLVYRSWGQYSMAQEYFEKALAVYKEGGNVKEEAVTVHNVAQAYYDWGQYYKAMEMFQKALDINTRLGRTQQQGWNYNDLGLVYRSWGQYSKALEYFDKALQVYRAAGNLKEEANTLGNISDVHVQMGEYARALANREDSLAIKKKIGVPTKWTIDQIGNIYVEMGRVDLAEPMIKEAGYSASLGRLALIKGDYPKAREHYEALIARAEKTRHAESLFIGYTGAGEAYEGLKDLPKAAEFYEKGIKLTEEIRSGLLPSEREMFFSVRIGGFDRTAPYEGLARVMMSMGKPLEALERSEHTKARVFAESLSRWSEGKTLDVPADVSKKDAELTQQLAALKKARQKGYEKENQEIVAALEPQVKDLEAKLAAHIKMLRDRYPLYAATKYPQPMELSQSALSDNEWLLSYDVTESGILMYLTRGKRLVKGLFKPMPRSELDSLVRKFREPLEVVPGKDDVLEKLRTFDFASGKKLFDVLLGPILSEIPEGSPLIVVPDDCLGVLPFEILVLDDNAVIKMDKEIPYCSGARFFGDRNPVSYYQSATALTLARSLGKEASAGDRMLIVADPVYQPRDERAQRATTTKLAAGTQRFYTELMSAVEESSGGKLLFDRLRLTGDLADRLTNMFTGKVSAYTGLDASKENFLGKIAVDLRKFRSIVFATHGYFGTYIPGILEPVLILSTVPHGTDGFLRMSEVMGCRMSAGVVALTACQTGLGRTISGEGTMGMGRAFQYAGARSVLMSLWSVAEQSSVKLVETFFKHLGDGKTKPEALKLARDEVRKDGFDHPFFWGAFILVGEVD